MRLTIREKISYVKISLNIYNIHENTLEEIKQIYKGLLYSELAEYESDTRSIGASVGHITLRGLFLRNITNKLLTIKIIVSEKVVSHDSKHLI